jgi:hypothetical protein
MNHQADVCTWSVDNGLPIQRAIMAWQYASSLKCGTQLFIFFYIFILPSVLVIPPTVLWIYNPGIINSFGIIGAKGVPT